MSKIKERQEIAKQVSLESRIEALEDAVDQLLLLANKTVPSRVLVKTKIDAAKNG